MQPEVIRTDFTYHYPPFNLLSTSELSAVGMRSPFHVYVHIPFCKSICEYCYFKTWGVGDRSEARLQEYLNSLLKEIEMSSLLPELQGRKARSLYIGGGTPSLLSVPQIESLVGALFGAFDFMEGFEFCIEAYPDDQIMSSEKVECLKRMGVTRLSMGVQSLDNRILSLNGRPGNVETVRRIYGWARDLQFKVINLDFMSGLLGENWDNWKRQIDNILELAPQNVSIYKLELYLNTKLTDDIKGGKFEEKLMGDSEEAEFAQYAFDRLQDEGGYIACNCFHLTRSPEVEHVYLKSLWDGEEVLGMGLSAYSVISDIMYQNTSSLEGYYAEVAGTRLPIQRAHLISEREKLARTMVYGIKALRLERQRFIEKHGFDMSVLYGKQIEELVEKGFLEFNSQALQVPKNKYIYADDICRYFFLPEHEAMMRGHVPREKVLSLDHS